MATLKKPAAKPVAKPGAKPASKVAAKPVAKPAVKTATAKKTFPARKTAVAGAKKPAAKAKLPTFKAPADFKPAFIEYGFTIGKDGLIDTRTVECQRVKGRWDNADAPRYDMRSYDINTVMGITARLSSVTFAPNILRRLAAGSKFKLVIRVAKRAADGSLAAGIKVGQFLNEKGKMAWFEDKADPDWRRLRRANRQLPSAFVDIQLPPSKRTKKVADEE